MITNIFRRSALTVLATALLVTAAAAFDGGVASAYSVSRNGTTGRLIAPATVARAGMQFTVPNPTVTRNGVVALGLNQQVTIEYELQYYTRSGWVLVDWMAAGPTFIPEWSNSVVLPGVQLTPRFNFTGAVPAGAYRVVYVVKWGSNGFNGLVTPWTGTMAVFPNLTSDMACGVNYCSAQPGYLYLS